MPAHKLRYRSGQVQLRKVRVEEDTVIQPGDLLFFDAGFARPSHKFPSEGNIQATRKLFARKFLGIAHSRSVGGETDPISVDVSPLAAYEVEVEPQSYEFGDLIGLSDLSGADVTQVDKPEQAIARAAEFAPGRACLLRVQFASAFHPGSANIHASVG